MRVDSTLLSRGVMPSESGNTMETHSGPDCFRPSTRVAFVLGVLAICSAVVSGQSSSSFHERACASYPASTSPWHIANLYDCETRVLHVPYHLWTGTEWDGSHVSADACMHEAQTEFRVNGTSLTRISGPLQWTNPVANADEQVWVRKKADGSKTSYFTCHEMGVGRVHDSRPGRADRHWATGRCKFPAGDGWEVGKRRSCTSTAIEITEVGIDRSGIMTHLTFKWWTGGTLDHVYRFVPNYGMTNAWDQT